MSVAGQLRVIDFELSNRFHQCVPHDCDELQGLALEDVAPNRQLWLAISVAGVILLGLAAELYAKYIIVL